MELNWERRQLPKISPSTVVDVKDSITKPGSGLEEDADGTLRYAKMAKFRRHFGSDHGYEGTGCFHSGPVDMVCTCPDFCSKVVG